MLRAAVLLLSLVFLAVVAAESESFSPPVAPGSVLHSFSYVDGKSLGMATGVSVTSTGVVLVADFLRFVAFDMNGTLLWCFNSTSQGGDVAVDESDVVYYASGGPILVFNSSTGEQQRVVSANVDGYGGGSRIHAKGGLLYVSIGTGSRASGDILAVVNATDGSNVQHWQLPQVLIGGIAVNSYGDIFVVDEQGSNLYLIAAGNGSEPVIISQSSLLYIPVGLAVDSHDRLYLADSYHARVVVLEPNGINVTAVFDVGTYPYGMAVCADGSVAVTMTGHQPNYVLILQGLPSNSTELDSWLQSGDMLELTDQ